MEVWLAFFGVAAFFGASFFGAAFLEATFLVAVGFLMLVLRLLGVFSFFSVFLVFEATELLRFTVLVVDLATDFPSAEADLFF